MLIHAGGLITSARKLAQSVLNQTIEPGTPIAKIVDESVEQGLILAARQLAQRSSDPIETWEQCLNLYDCQPALNTRTSTSILQQAYSTPIPIAFLAAKLAQIDGETTVYEPTAGNDLPQQTSFLNPRATVQMKPQCNRQR